MTSDHFLKISAWSKLNSCQIVEEEYREYDSNLKGLDKYKILDYTLT